MELGSVTKTKDQAPSMEEKVLVIDRDYALRSMINYTLALERFDVIEADDCEAALREIGSGLRPALIIAGCGQGGPEDLSFIRALRETEDLRRIPVIMMVAGSDLDRMMEWRKAGATCWIVRPFTSDQLIEMIRMVLRRS